MKEEKTRLTFWMPKSVNKRFRHYAVEQDKKLTDALSEILEEYLEKNGY